MEDGTLLGLIRLVNDDAVSLDCPESCEGIHLYLLRAVAHYEEMTQLLADGIDELDAEKLQAASDEMTLGTEAIHEATARTEALTD